MRRRLLPACLATLAGLGTAAAGVAAGLPYGVTLLLVFLVVYGGLFAWLRLTFPARVRAAVGRLRDDAAGPPHGARELEEPVVDRWLAAVAARDRAALAAMLTDDFEYHLPTRRRPVKRRGYLRILRWRRSLVGATQARLERVCADPAAPDTVWVSVELRTPARRGRGIHVSRWERWTLTPDRGRIRAMTLVAFTEPPVRAPA
jgi:ketosteroid isomerase-like protein